MFWKIGLCLWLVRLSSFSFLKLAPSVNALVSVLGHWTHLQVNEQKLTPGTTDRTGLSSPRLILTDPIKSCTEMAEGCKGEQEVCLVLSGGMRGTKRRKWSLKMKKRKMSWIEHDGLLQCTARASLILDFFPAWKKASLPQLTQKTVPFPVIFALFLPNSKTSSYIESYCIGWSIYKAWKQSQSFFPFVSTWKIFADNISAAVCFSCHKLFYHFGSFKLDRALCFWDSHLCHALAKRNLSSSWVEVGIEHSNSVCFL